MIRNYADETPFHLAAREGKFGILKLYFETFQFDADIDSMVRDLNLSHSLDQDGWTAVHYAALNGFLSCVELLHKHGANISAQDKLKRNALHWACKYN